VAAGSGGSCSALAVMKRLRKVLVGCLIAAVIVGALVWAVGYYSTGDFRERRAVLQPLLATNAPLPDVEARTSVRFTVTRRSSPEWTQMLARYRAGSKWDRYIADKMEATSGVGHTSTMWMQTWIFLDEHDRLVGFELGTQ
jgi:hypothetical protein